MPRPLEYGLQRGQHLEVEIKQPDGGRPCRRAARRHPLTTRGGGVMRIRVCAERVLVLGAEQPTAASHFTNDRPSP
jgi:hypothetical protein